LQHPSADALGRIICLLCSISCLSLIHAPRYLAAAAAATAILRCGVVYNSQQHPPLAQPVSATRDLSVLNFDFVWKGNLDEEGVMEEGGKRVGSGFRDLIRALGDVGREGGRDPAFHAALLDVQVLRFRRAICFASWGHYPRFDRRFTGIIRHV
jgi:hypothetical protein